MSILLNKIVILWISLKVKKNVQTLINFITTLNSSSKMFYDHNKLSFEHFPKLFIILKFYNNTLRISNLTSQLNDDFRVYVRPINCLNSSKFNSINFCMCETRSRPSLGHIIYRDTIESS